MARVLIVGPDIRSRIRLASALMRAGFLIRYATNEEQAREVAVDWQPDLTLLGPANLNELALQSGTLRRDLKAPLIAIGSPSEGTDALVAVLNAGADDYLSTATSPEEVVARVRAILRWRPEAAKEMDPPETLSSPELDAMATESDADVRKSTSHRIQAQEPGSARDTLATQSTPRWASTAREMPRRAASFAGRCMARIVAHDLVHH